MAAPVRNDPRITKKLAVNGGPPVRTRPFSGETPGALWYDGQETAAVAEVVKRRSPFRYYGPDVVGAVDRFEKRFAAFMRRKYAIALNSGTSSLMAAMAAMAVGPGQEVIVPGFMWVSTVTAAVRLGAVPVLCEIDDSFTMDPRDLENKITPRTSLVVPVHMKGVPCDMARIMRVARKARVRVLEDTAQATGGKFNGRPLGAWGDVGIYSLQLNKNMTTGEGGMLVTDSRRLYSRAFAFHDLGYPREHGIASAKASAEIIWGNGSRMTEMQGALGIVQLGKLRSLVAHMRKMKYYVIRGIAGLPGLRPAKVNDEKGDSGPSLITIHDTPAAARTFTHAVRAEGVPVNPIWEAGLHVYSNMANLVRKLSISPDGFPWTHPANKYAKNTSYAKGALPRTDHLIGRSIACPIVSDLTLAAARDIIVAYRKVALALAK